MTQQVLLQQEISDFQDILSNLRTSGSSYEDAKAGGGVGGVHVLTSHRSSGVWAMGRQKMNLRRLRSPHRPTLPGSGPNTPPADRKTRSCCRPPAAESRLYPETSQPQTPDREHENSNTAGSEQVRSSTDQHG